MTPSPATLAYAPHPLVASDHDDPLEVADGHLAYVAWAWPDLVEYRLHGTERPWSEVTAASLPARMAAEAAARDERLERVGLAPGERPVPLRVDVLDLLHRVIAATADIALTVGRVLDDYPPREHPPALDARPWLTWVREHLIAADARDLRTLPWVADQLTPLVTAVARTLGDVLEGQVLAALCPWCGGRGPDGLEGARTLRVHYPDHRGDGEPVVACHGRACGPPLLARAGRDAHGRPAWAQHHWPWLAHRLEPLPTEGDRS